MIRPSHILPVIIFSQFTGTSLWFAGNAVVLDLQRDWRLVEQSVGYITAAVQLGFISGTLVFAYLAIADRFSARRVFFICSLAGAVANIGVLAAPQGLAGLLMLRFATGFFLAGIYPVGMKIAAGWYEQGLGRALGYLVGALVLGTAFPHLIRSSGAELPWQQVMIGVSALAAAGGVLMLMLVPDGPYLPKGSAFNPRSLAIIFRSRLFRASAFGYFGHMWELYALWAFIPIWLLAYSKTSGISLNVPLWSFLVIAIGFLGCAVGGVISAKVGSAKVAAIQLTISGACCLLSPLFFGSGFTLFIIFLLIWGITVVGDSPQFSALNAENAPREYVGSALTIANSIGFLITVFSIQLVNVLLPLIGPQYVFWLLLPGPLVGLWMLKPLLESRPGS
ncbi:MAG: MFS transporter [Gammaproteobacteria bacterium]|nr:MAG: MFS transporter [Gammaproteobacteria bacterium]UCH38485.1 MAG: MFS transporter [Gammaproteobacteria bacterium]